ncbi:MAG: hypothetical protein AAF741_12750 [Bacteroidota bacterium]
MSKQENFEDWRQRLEKYSSPLDVDSEWASIAPNLQKNRKANRWPILLFFLLIGILSIVSYSISNAKTEPSNEESAHHTAFNSTTIPQSNVLDTLIDRIASTKAEGLNIDKSDLQKSMKEEKKNIELAEDIVAPEPLTVSDNSNSIQDSLIGDDKRKEKPDYTHSEQTSNESASERLKNTGSPVEIEKQGAIKNINSLAISEIYEPLLDRVQPLSMNSSNAVTLEKPKPLIYFSAGLGTTQQRFSSDDLDTSLMRSDFEEHLETFSLELGARWPLSNRTFLTTGLTFYNWTDQFSVDYTAQQDFLLEDVLIRIIENQTSGETEEVFGDTIISGFRNVSAVHYNEYRAYGLTFGLGTDLWRKGQWHVSLGVDAILEMRFTARGRYLEQPTLISDLQDFGYNKNRLGWSARLQLGLGYNLNENWTIMFAPFAQNRFSNLLDSGSDNKATYWRLGMNLGVGYRL